MGNATKVSAPMVVTVSDASGFPPVKLGCKDGAVELLQIWLNSLGYALTIDKEFGDETEEKVKAFQADHGLEADGCVSSLTWMALTQSMYDAQSGIQD